MPLEHGSAAVFNVGGRFYAVDDLCLRCGTSLTSGRTDGSTVTCSGCGWRYALETGALEGLPSLRLEVYEARVVDGAIVVNDPLADDVGRGGAGR